MTIRAYIASYVGGLEYVDIHKDRVATRDKAGRAGKRARRGAGAVQQPYFGCSSQCGYRVLRKGDMCRLSRDPANMFRCEKNKAVGPPVGPQTNPKAVGAATFVPPTSGDREGISRNREVGFSIRWGRESK